MGDSKAPGPVAAVAAVAAVTAAAAVVGAIHDAIPQLVRGSTDLFWNSSLQNRTSTFLFGDGEAIQMLLTNLHPFGRKS